MNSTTCERCATFADLRFLATPRKPAPGLHSWCCATDCTATCTELAQKLHNLHREIKRLRIKHLDMRLNVSKNLQSFTVLKQIAFADMVLVAPLREQRFS